MTTIETTAEADVRSAERTLLIDTDVHQELKSLKDLAPYLDPHWRRYVTREGGFWAGQGFENQYALPVPLAREEWFLADGSRGTDPEVLARHLFDEEGVSIGILFGNFHISRNERDYEFMQALARAYNDWQIEHWLERDSRLRGSVIVVAHEPEPAAKEIDRVAKHPQIVQVALPTVTNRQYGDPFYRPIFEAAVRNGLVVALHHSLHTDTVLGSPRYYIEWHTTAAPHANQCQLISLICNGTFDLYPELKVILLETGVAWVPWLMWRLDQQYRELRSNVPWLKRMPSEHMRGSVRVATQPMSDVTPEQFVQLVEMVDAGGMYVFSTDYPHYDADSAKAVLPGTLPEWLRRRIRYENALETYPRLADLKP
jgi:predicted TIM-barrel fold metal-dependent hydrolase